MYSQKDSDINNSRIKKVAILLTVIFAVGIIALIPTLM